MLVLMGKLYKLKDQLQKLLILHSLLPLMEETSQVMYLNRECSIKEK